MWIEYHRGNLTKDRMKDSRVDTIASQAYKDAQAGKLTIVQRRNGKGDYSYLKRAA